MEALHRLLSVLKAVFVDYDVSEQQTEGRETVVSYLPMARKKGRVFSDLKSEARWRGASAKDSGSRAECDDTSTGEERFCRKI